MQDQLLGACLERLVRYLCGGCLPRMVVAWLCATDACPKWQLFGCVQWVLPPNDGHLDVVVAAHRYKVNTCFTSHPLSQKKKKRREVMTHEGTASPYCMKGNE